MGGSADACRADVRCAASLELWRSLLIEISGIGVAEFDERVEVENAVINRLDELDDRHDVDELYVGFTVRYGDLRVEAAQAVPIRILDSSSAQVIDEITRAGIPMDQDLTIEEARLLLTMNLAVFGSNVDYSKGFIWPVDFDREMLFSDESEILEWLRESVDETGAGFDWQVRYLSMDSGRMIAVVESPQVCDTSPIEIRADEHQTGFWYEVDCIG